MTVGLLVGGAIVTVAGGYSDLRARHQLLKETAVDRAEITKLIAEHLESPHPGALAQEAFRDEIGKLREELSAMSHVSIAVSYIAKSVEEIKAEQLRVRGDQDKIRQTVYRIAEKVQAGQ